MSDLLGVYHIVFLSLLGWIAVYDWRRHRIPDPCSALMAGLGFLSVPVRAVASGPMGGGNILLLLADSFAGALIGGGTLLLVSLATKGGFGGGDIKLMAGLGLAYGTVGTVMVLLIAVVATIFAGIVQRIKCAGGTPRIAFAPFLFLGCIAAHFIM